jgi:threonine synthase
MSTHQWRGVIEEYREYLPVDDATPVITLGEGGTPLVYACAASAKLEGDVWLKVEAGNPTGSFKDRGMTMAVSKAAQAGMRALVCASTGNTSASAAAYAAKGALTSAVIIPEGKVTEGKLAQAVAHGARVLQVPGNFDSALRLVRELGEKYPIAVVNSINPDRIEGQKTAAFEVVDALGFAPDIHALPVGNAGNITAYWRGYREYNSLGRIVSLPRMFGFQAAGAAPLVVGHPIAQPETIATAIRIGDPASADHAIAARDESGGLIEAVTDEQILEAHRFLSAIEGVFIEPASAAGLAGLFALKEAGRLPGGQRIVVTVTGHGLKDVQWALRGGLQVHSVASAEQAAAALDLA